MLKIERRGWHKTPTLIIGDEKIRIPVGIEHILQFLVLMILVLTLFIIVYLVVNNPYRSGPSKGIQQGEVYDMEYQPARTYTSLIPIISSNGKNFTTRTIPVTRYDDEDFIIYIRAWDEEAETFNTNTFYVDEEVYQSIEIGNEFAFDGSLGDYTDPGIRTREQGE